MAVRFFKTADNSRLAKTGSGRCNPVMPGLPEEPGDWVEINSNEYYWRKQGLKKRKSAPKRKTHLDLAVDLANEGPEAVHAYCMEHFGHESRTTLKSMVEVV